MDNPLTREEQTMLIEDALQTYPMVSMPGDITEDVLARIRSVPAPRPFRLAWHDLALALILALCAGAVWFSLQNLPSIVAAQMRKESILLYQYILVNARWLTPGVAFGLAGLFAALTIPYLRAELRKESA